MDVPDGGQYCFKVFHKTSFCTRCCNYLTTFHFKNVSLCSDLLDIYHNYPARYIVITRQVPLVEQELLLIPLHLSSPPVFSGVRVTRSLVLWVCFVDRCLSFFSWPLRCLFFFDLRILITPLVPYCNKMSLYNFSVTNPEYL